MVEGQQTVLIEAVTDLAQAQIPITRACQLVGLARSTYYRIYRGYRHYQPVADPIPQADRVQPAALTQAERDHIAAILIREEYAKLSVDQTYWRVFDTAEVGCSERSFYRVAGACRLSGDRRRVRAGGKPRKAPTAVASRPNELWSWDATELYGPGRQRYKLSAIIDVYSRFPIGWRIEYYESWQGAVEMFATAIDRHGAPAVVHSDNGGPMRSHQLVNRLEAHHASVSYSRPRVSDDNPFSESLFKTLKYDLDCPPRFDSIEHARAWTGQFFYRYQSEHRHSGLARHTPESVYHGTADTIRAQRQTHLDHYYQQHPERFQKPPKALTLKPTGINPHLSQTG